MALAGLGAPLTLLGAVVHGVIGGWDFDPFENADAAPPGYSVVIALGAIAFATGSVLVGAAHLRNPTARTPAALLIAGGVMYVPAIPLGGLGHALWALPWLGIGAVLVTLRSEPRSDVRVPVRATRH